MQPEQLRKLTRKWAIPIIVVMILGAAASYLISKRLTPTYAATGKVQVVVGPGQSGGSGGISISATEATTTAASLITAPKLLQQVIAKLGLHTDPASLSKQVTAVAESNTELVDVTATDPSPAQAALIANALMDAYVAQVSQANAQQLAQAGAVIQGQIVSLNAAIDHESQQAAAARKAKQDPSPFEGAIAADNTQLGLAESSLATIEGNAALGLNAVSVPEYASAPTKPASPNVLLNTVAGGLAALLIAAGAAYLLEFLDQGLKSAEDVRERLGLPCLGVVPKFRHIPSHGNTGGPNHRHDEAVRESYRRLRVNLLFAAPDGDLKTVVITSVRAGEGKTCTAANLAVALAGSDRHVLLIDADLRKPDQHRLFETSLEGGLSELILKTPVSAIVQLNGYRTTQFANLSLLTSGIVPPNPAELLASKRATTLLQAIGPREDLIIIDTAPAGLVTDPLSIAAGASATILVVEAGKTKASLAVGTIEALREVGANVIGVVLNKSSRRVGAGYQYGYSRYGQVKASHAHEATAGDLVPPQAPPMPSENGASTRVPPRSAPLRPPVQ